MKEEVKEAKPKRQTHKDRIQCPKCFKEMAIKSNKYSHEKNCQGQLSERPVKHHTNPKPKPKPKAKPQITTQEKIEEEEEEDIQQQPVKFKLIKPNPQPANTITSQQHYQLLQNEYVKQKQERYNKLCSNMFSKKT